MTSNSPDGLLRRAREFRELAARRRTVRAFESRPAARELIAECIAAAGMAPSGANQQTRHRPQVAGGDQQLGLTAFNQY